jgi:hypothetical protein
MAAVALFMCLTKAHPQISEPSKFEVFVEKQIASGKIKPAVEDRRETKLQRLCPTASSLLARKVFFDYGAVFSGHEVTLPPRCVFENSQQVAEFQNRLKIGAVNFGPFTIELQESALRALLDARNEAADAGLKITPLDGSVAARRSYEDTVRIWNSRFDRALSYWNRRGSITDADADAVRAGPFAAQAERVIAWESNGFWFGTSLRSTIFSSVAPPGTSQHLSLLAIDVVEYADPALVAILNKHGWFQTIVGDGPHFTYLGVTADRLPTRGLRFVYVGSRGYWVPDQTPAPHNPGSRPATGEPD